jgi:hypothetical protein
MARRRLTYLSTLLPSNFAAERRNQPPGHIPLSLQVSWMTSKLNPVGCIDMFGGAQLST